MTEKSDPDWGASLDQEDVVRPFKAMPGGSYSHSGGVPMKHRPLGQAAWSDCIKDGLDVSPGDLVIDSKGRWCLVWNDAIDLDRAGRH